MNKEISIKQFIQAIQKLPFDERREQWIRWLSEYHTPGYYQRLIVKGRNAKFAYNHVANPKMLLWLIQAAGVSKNLVKLAKFDCNKVVDMHQQSAAIRKHVPWEALEGPLQKLLEKEATHWLQYWKPFQIEPAITEPWLLNHSAGNQLGRVKPGDIVWIISVEHRAVKGNLMMCHYSMDWRGIDYCWASWCQNRFSISESTRVPGKCGIRSND